MPRSRGAPRRPRPGTPGRRISVLLADDHTVVREGLRLLLESEPDITVVGEAEDGRRAVGLARSLAPDVVVMDIAMPGLNGIEATRRIRETCPGTRVLILSAHGDDAYIERVTSLGPVGYVLKQDSLENLARAIRETSGGRPYVSPPVRRRLRAPLRRAGAGPTAGPGRVPRLSPREAEVLQLIAEGRANKETAAILGISIKTVEKHRQRLMEKLDIHDVAGLTRYAVTAGIVECRGGAAKG